MPAYLGEIDFGLRHLVNHEIRAANRRLLREHGWGPRQRAVFVATKCFETLLHDPRWVIERLTVRQLAGADWAMPIWRWLNRRGVSWTPGGLRLFDSPEEGLAFALRHSRTRARQLGSLRRRRITRESGQEVLAAANGQHATEPTADGSRASSTASAQHQAK